MASVTFERLEKTYPDGTRAVSDLDLEIADGEFMVLVGPSGCGKTTALRMVAGLEEVTGGQLRIGDQVVNSLEPRKRDVAMVFQNYALYPHMTVFDNIAFPLASQGVPKKEIKARVGRTAALLGLEEHLKRRPRNLSGGQRQRVAMGRAIVRQPQVFLMDEPLSNLDAKLRVQMRAEIANLQRELGTTTIYVTHDQVEAMTMGDRIAVMRKGVLQQEGTPQTLYDEPANLFVATFVGSPAMNLFQAVIVPGDDSARCRIGEQELALPPEAVPARARLAEGSPIAVGIRPEDLIDPAGADPAWPRLKGKVTMVETLGFERLVHVAIAAEPVLTADVLEVARDTDEASVERLHGAAQERRVVAVARFAGSSQVATNSTQELAVRPHKVRLFDMQTGSAIHWLRGV